MTFDEIINKFEEWRTEANANVDFTLLAIIAKKTESGKLSSGSILGIGFSDDLQMLVRILAEKRNMCACDRKQAVDEILDEALERLLVDGKTYQAG